MSIIRTTLFACSFAALSLACGGSKEPAESPESETSEAVEEAGEEVEEAAEEASDEIEEATE